MDPHDDAPQPAVAGSAATNNPGAIHATQRKLLLWVIVAVAIGLRIWGLEYGASANSARPDEEKIVGPAAAVVREGYYAPKTLIYPSLLIYVDALALALAGVARRWLGWGELFDAWPRAPFLVCRAVSVLAGVVTVFVTERLGRALGVGSPGTELEFAL